jgi:hypothetical protein
MSSREWVSRLQATLHAAVFRSMEGTQANGLQSVKEGQLPVITVLIQHGDSVTSAKKAFLRKRELLRLVNPRMKPHHFSELDGRREYQSASVHGRMTSSPP